MCIRSPKIHLTRNTKEEEETEREDGSTSPDIKSLHKAVKQQRD